MKITGRENGGLQYKGFFTLRQQWFYIGDYSYIPPIVLTVFTLRQQWFYIGY
jgi:hypothetical protein